MIRYWPVSSVTAVRVFSIRTGLAASTVTPGRTAPDASFTTPAMDACAYADSGRANTIDRTIRIRRDVRMQELLLTGRTGRLVEWGGLSSVKYRDGCDPKSRQNASKRHQ